MKIGIVGTNGIPARYGGFETLTEYLTKFSGEEFSIAVYCPKTKSSSRLEKHNNARLIYLPFRSNGPQSVIYDIVSIIHSLVTNNKTLILGTSGAIILPLLFPWRKRLIVNFGGLEWKREKWSYLTRKYLKFTEWLAVQLCSQVVADNQAFVDYVLAEYERGSTLIEYGGDHTTKKEITPQLEEKYPFVNFPYFLSVSRAQPDNNIEMLIETFQKENLSKKTLVIISNWNVSAYGKHIINTFRGKFANILLLDAIYDPETLDAIRSNCAVYIHSHSFCGTAPSLVEMMNLNRPILCFKTDTNVATTEGESNFFADSTELAKLILTITESDLDINAKKMFEIAKRRYTWKIITEKYKNVFLRD
jgi:glycosyltransferase involved in cell wall biosynthesis